MQLKLEKFGNVLNRFEVRLVVALLIILIVGSTYKIVIMPLQNEKSHYESMVQENKTALTGLTQIEISLEKQISSNQAQTLEKSVTTALPSSVFFDTEVLNLTSFFNSSGVRVQGLTPGAIITAAPVSGFPISITASGSSNSVIQFLRLLENQVQVHGQNITATGPLWIVKSVTIGSSATTAGSNAPATTADSIQGVILFSPQNK